jgi:hypothetical protein
MIREKGKAAPYRNEKDAAGMGELMVDQLQF